MKSRFLVAILLCVTFMVNAQVSDVSQSEWMGFHKTAFTIDSSEAHIVFPEEALPGNPWVWRARFPGYHAEVDSAFLAAGFHVLHVNTANRFGSPQAMQIWDDFYDYVTDKYALQAKAALHAHSRGGLFAYTWAKRHPERIACIYADAIVCDFKSWPAGFGNGEGSAKSWKVLKAEYGFENDDQARAYDNNPIDNLEALAIAGVPIFHTIGLSDGVVPPEENSLLLVNNYIRLGGTATVASLEMGIPGSAEHHYGIPEIQTVLDYILYYSCKDAPLSSTAYHTMRSSLLNSRIKFERYKKGRVAFLGGSITANDGWRDSICAYLQERFPETEFDFVAAGIPSMGTTPGAFRLERDVLSAGPIDLLFEEAAVNDNSNRRSDDDQKRAMEGIVRHVREANPSVDLVMMHFVDPAKMKDYRAGIEPQVIANHNQVAIHYNISTINLAQEVTERIDNGEFTWKDDFKNLHPSPFGQGVYAHSMLEFLDNAYAGHIDADDKIEDHTQPPFLDAFAYANGKLYEATQVKNSKGWTVDSSWNPNDGRKCRPNYVDVPMLVGEKPGSSFKYPFEGNAIGFTVAAGFDAGMITYRIDKGEWQTKDLYTPWSKRLHLPWYHTLADGLDHGKHTLELKIAEEKNSKSKGHACRIRYFYVNAD